jgi:hypothetical protein
VVRLGGGGAVSVRIAEECQTLPSVDLTIFLRTALNGRLISIAVIQGLKYLPTEEFRAICGNWSSQPPIFESKLSFKRYDVAREKQTLKILGNLLVTSVSMCVNLNAETFRLYHL